MFPVQQILSSRANAPLSRGPKARRVPPSLACALENPTSLPAAQNALLPNEPLLGFFMNLFKLHLTRVSLLSRLNPGHSARKKHAQEVSNSALFLQHSAARRPPGGALHILPVDMRALLILVLAAPAFAQSIQYDSGRKVWLLTTRLSSYAMGVSPDGSLLILYWGPPLWRIADLPAAARHRAFRDRRQLVRSAEHRSRREASYKVEAVDNKLVEKQPDTTWNLSAPNEYGFYSNVNPQVDHPRWSQAKERRLGDFFRRSTLMFNGYDQVASLYAGMDLRKDF